MNASTTIHNARKVTASISKIPSTARPEGYFFSLDVSTETADGSSHTTTYIIDSTDFVSPAFAGSTIVKGQPCKLLETTLIAPRESSQ